MNKWAINRSEYFRFLRFNCDSEPGRWLIDSNEQTAAACARDTKMAQF